jgi:hypothetical protein
MTQFAFDPTHDELLIRLTEKPYAIENFEKASALGIPKNVAAAFALHGVAVQKELLARWQRDAELYSWDGSISPDPQVNNDKE